MKVRVLVIGVLVVGLALIPATAHAKGAKDVTISGPGLERPVQLSATNDTSATLQRLADATGLYAAAFRQTPSPLAAERPTGNLGPRYLAVYAFYAADARQVIVRQQLYPSAEAGFVTYTPPGQKVFRSEALSGWFRSDRAGANLLVSMGVPVRGASVVPAAAPSPVMPSPADAIPRMTG